MLKKCRDPRNQGIKLTPINNAYKSKTGWLVEGFVGDDGNVYERATSRTTVKWFILKETNGA